ncbi:ATP-dependent nuclease [Paenibacillus polymyxa]|uniref:ATP-dependent nuclease n=1 Tax=Paenibacillus polymyxa TaxID=1406 RepID=UPI00202476BE|nr:AAA family ATPase [Paenibacillus polymyxa]URJ48511.3 AAA family ATPase [Paenibacillus polymyxa]
MRLKDVEVKNYRLLKNITGDNNVHIDMNTTLIVGKNNSGKTSFTHVFERFLKDRKFEWEDFSSECHNNFRSVFQNYLLAKEDEKKKEDFFQTCVDDLPSIELILTVEYTDQDNWSNIKPLLTTLDESNSLKISFKYGLEQINIFFEHLQKEYVKNSQKDIISHIKGLYNKYFNLSIKPVSDDVEVEKISPTDINKIFGTCFIAAQREVDDGNSRSNSKLSSVFQKEYKNRSDKSSSNKQTEIEIESLNEEIYKANEGIDIKLGSFFEDFIRSYSTFGYPSLDDTTLTLKSNVTVSNLFTGIKLFYKDNEHLLPEKYNGLGYSNLIYIISEILSFKSTIKDNGTDLNLIFIEEPEAHMHPQLQSVLVQRINVFLNQNEINAQVIITTHSSHIVSNSSFDSIRYFCRFNKQLIVKDMKKFTITENTTVQDDQENSYDIDTLKFLKRYITLVKCDMFFADKIIMVEGLCERLLMPLFIKEVDNEIALLQRKKVPIKILEEQYISLIEVSGAYMHKFKEFLEFLGVKTLIITDIDCCKLNEKLDVNDIPIKYKNGEIKKYPSKYEIKSDEINELITTNPTLINWIPQTRLIKELIGMPNEKKFQKNVGVAYQTNYYAQDEHNIGIKCGRTFEEAFLIENTKYILENKGELSSIYNKIKKYTNDNEIFDNSYSIYEYIDKYDKKSNFAFDLMYLKGWQVPSYIKEGLLWLAK